MSKVDLSDFGQSRTKLVPEDLKQSPCLLTVATVERVEVPDPTAPTGLRKALTLLFEEFPNRPLWLNKGQIETLIAQLGDEDAAWVGATVPVERTVAEYRGQRFPKVRVVPAEEWDHLLAASRVGARPKAAAVKVSRGRR
jgi:hypothetical protein